MPWHIRQRGNNGIACFAGDEDRELYLGMLGELSADTGCDVHAYVLMTNHVHLLLTPEEADGPSRLMKRLGERYVRLFNKRRGRYGTLWEGRFRSSLVDSDAYLITCHRYIEMNPVRAKMVAHPRDHAWSSYRCNAEGEPSTFVKPHCLYDALGDSLEARREAYRKAFAASLTAPELQRIRDAINGGYALGRREFLRRLQGELRRKVQRAPRGRPRKRDDTFIDAVLF